MLNFTTPVFHRGRTMAVGCLATFFALTSANAEQIAPTLQVNKRAGAATTTLATDSHTLVHSEIIDVPDANWIRLQFNDVRFEGFEPNGPGYLRLTSLMDGGVQVLDFDSYLQWHQRSAYFNGDAVLLEAWSNRADASAVVDVLNVRSDLDGRGGDSAPRSICGNDDNRMLTDDDRVARIVLSEFDPTIVCTASLINDANGCFLTSGGCAASMDNDTVIEFNPPLTLPNGTVLMHPAPADQYVPDLSSVQSQSAGDGEDWGYFGCFTNSTTGLSPRVAQGDNFTMASQIDLSEDDVVRGFGCGATAPPLFRTWSFLPKETDGTFEGLVDSELSVRVDATAGDSGMAITDGTTDDLIGILTNDGCDVFVGANIATAITNEELRKALTTPLGVCVPIITTILGGAPDLVNPDGTTTVMVEFLGVNGTNPVADTAVFHYSTGGPYESVSMNSIGFNLYEATFPANVCGTLIDYYFSVMTDTGARFPDQLPNPVTTLRAAYATGTTTVLANNFEDLNGWDISNTNVTAGAFAIGTPGGNGNDGAPTADFDGSGQCVLTGPMTNEDLDGGPTRLRSPSVDLGNSTEPFITFAVWMNNDDADDTVVLQASTNGGLFWDNIAIIGDNGPQWLQQRIRLNDFITPNAFTRFRFQVSDSPNNSRTEAAIDAFELIDYECAGAVVTCDKGDINLDGQVNGGDVAGFVGALLGNNGVGTPEFCATDFDDDNTLEIGDDLNAFVDCLLNGSCQ